MTSQASTNSTDTIDDSTDTIDDDVVLRTLSPPARDDEELGDEELGGNLSEEEEASERAQKRRRTSEEALLVAVAQGKTAITKQDSLTPPHNLPTRIPLVDDPTKLVLQLPEWVSHRCRVRLPNFMNFAHFAGPWYGLGVVPEHTATSWIPIGHNTTALALRNDDKKLRIFATGALASMAVLTNSNPNSPRARIAIKLLRDVDKIAARSLLNRGTRNNVTKEAQPTDPVEVLRAVCMPPFPTFLDRIVDATVHYTAQSKMKTLCPSSLRVGDIVMVEAMLISSGNSTASVFAACFHATRVAVIAHAPRSNEVALDADEPEFWEGWRL